MAFKQRSNFNNRSRDGQRRPRRDLRILTPEDLSNDAEGVVLKRDQVSSRFTKDLRSFILKNRKQARERASLMLSRESMKKREVNKFTRFHMGDIQVSQLEAGSSRGNRLANSSHRNQVDFKAIRSLLEEHQNLRPRQERGSVARKEERLNKRRIIAKFGKNPLDTGSTAVQIALKTARIESLKAHFATAKKDKHSKRGFIQLIQDRKALLRYLRETKPEEYRRVLGRLNLRK